MSQTACKKCGGKTRVVHTDREGNLRIRRRKCDRCRLTFRTEQEIEQLEVVGRERRIVPAC